MKSRIRFKKLYLHEKQQQFPHCAFSFQVGAVTLLKAAVHSQLQIVLRCPSWGGWGAQGPAGSAGCCAVAAPPQPGALCWLLLCQEKHEWWAGDELTCPGTHQPWHTPAMLHTDRGWRLQNSPTASAMGAPPAPAAPESQKMCQWQGAWWSSEGASPELLLGLPAGLPLLLL